MEYLDLGKAGMRVSEVGFGAWAIGGDAWGPVEDDDSLTAMERALGVGTNFMDTADVYGDGRSESLVSQAIKGRRDEAILSTKGGLMGHHRDPEREPVYDQPEKIVEACEASLRRLETDHVDVYFCHIWWDEHEETEAFIEAFDRLKKDGKVRAVGRLHERPGPHKALRPGRRARRSPRRACGTVGRRSASRAWWQR